MHFWPFFFKNFNLSEKMNFCIKTRKQAIFLDYFKKSPRTTKKSINRSDVRLHNPAQ